MRPSILAALTTVVLCAACQPSAPAPAPVPPPATRLLSARAVEVPVPPGASLPMLAAAADGSLLLGWTEPFGSGHRIRFATRTGGGWSQPRTIVESHRLFVNWADTPSLMVLGDGRIAAHWLVKTGERGADYEIHLSTSDDGGQTWSPAAVPHGDGIDAEHGFVSLFPQGDSIGIVWLDGRALAGGHGHDGPGATALRHATVDPTGLVSEETVIDDRVCDCCQTGAAVSASRVVVAYRDRGGDERRDISVARLNDGHWSPPGELGRDGWIMPACPVNGPQLSARGMRVAAAWFTSPGGAGRVRFAHSPNAGATFLPAIDLDVDSPIGRVDVEWRAADEALVTWLRPLPPKSSQVVVRRIGTTGPLGDAVAIGETGEGRSSGFPRLAVVGGDSFVAWTDTRRETPQVRLVALSSR